MISSKILFSSIFTMWRLQIPDGNALRAASDKKDAQTGKTIGMLLLNALCRAFLF
jgi:hypothetical protein